MTTLTDRYVDATLRRLPQRQRLDIERELRASIADAVDDRVAAGEAAAAAETAVLTELGDPARLAAGYADRPLYLIGPGLFVDYTRVLGTLLGAAVPIVATVVAVVNVLGGDSVGNVIADTIGAAITTALHVAFWVTLFFAIFERTGARWAPTQAWTPAALPTPPSRRARYGELIAESAATVAFSALVLVSPMLGLKRDENGDPIPLLSPWLFDTGVVYVFIALVVATLVVSFMRYYARWRVALVLAGALVQLAPPVLMIWLAANDRVLNPAFVEAVGWSEDVTRWIDRGIIIAGVVGILSTIVETIRHPRRP